MKITREQQQFTPITIILETKDEADFLYGVLKINEIGILNEHFAKYKNIELEMLKKLDEVLK